MSSSHTMSISREISTSGFIDKLNLKLDVPILKFSGITKRLNSGFYFDMGNDVYLKRNGKELITNPSRFSSFSEYPNYLFQLFDKDIIQNSKISRIDLTVDYQESFKNLLYGLDIAHKTANIQYYNETRRTGLLIGKNNSKVCIYDKQLESGCSYPLTRIELQLRGKFTLIKYFKDLFFLNAKIKDSKIFSNVKLNDIKIKRKKSLRLEILLETIGYLLTRKELNRNNNFNRDYLPLLKITHLNNQPQKIIEEAMENFFRDE